MLCGDAISAELRRDARYCSKRCRNRVYCSRHPEKALAQRRRTNSVRRADQTRRKAETDRERARRQTAIYGRPLDTPEDIMNFAKDRYKAARAHGYRSGLEVKIAAELAAAGVPVAYEDKAPVDEGGCQFKYTIPARVATYTADWRLPNGIIVESKGRFVTEDRKKHKLLKEQFPHIDIRFVFSNPNARISKQSKTTYADWCNSQGIKYAKGSVPAEWLAEEPPK